MSESRWHKIYRAQVAAPPDLHFRLLSDLRNYTGGTRRPVIRTFPGISNPVML